MSARLLIVCVLFALSASIAVLQPDLAAALPAAGPELASPADRISESQIVRYQGGVQIAVPGVRVLSLADTNSMDPMLDVEANVLVVDATKPEDIHVGDIIIYQSGRYLIIHRVIELGKDSAWWARTKGDNNIFPDSKIRFEQVKGIVVGILY